MRRLWQNKLICWFGLQFSVFATKKQCLPTSTAKQVQQIADDTGQGLTERPDTEKYKQLKLWYRTIKKIHQQVN